MDIELEYNNRRRVPEHSEIIGKWKSDSEAFRRSWTRSQLGLSYGEREREKVDIFLPSSASEDGRDGIEGVAIFVHGGYWQALDGSFFSVHARGLVELGIAVAVPTYDLCPSVTLTEMCEQMRRCAAFVFKRFGGKRILATGHSAGGHTAAILLATNWPEWQSDLPENIVGSALPISGVFELAPLLSTTISEKLHLTEQEVAELSPQFFAQVPSFSDLHIVVGGVESSEFIRQSKEFANHWGGSYDALDAANHFTVIEPFTDSSHPLMRKAADMARVLVSGKDHK